MIDARGDDYHFDSLDAPTCMMLQIHEHLMPNESDFSEQKFRTFFSNFRINYSVENKTKTIKGLRLTKIGLRVFAKNFESYQHDHSNHLTLKLLYQLDQRVSRPYFISHTELILFDQIDSWSLQLSNSCLDTWLNHLSS